MNGPWHWDSLWTSQTEWQGKLVDADDKPVFLMPDVHYQVTVTPAVGRALPHLPDLMEALKPLAALCQPHQDDLPDESPLFAINHKVITAGDVRRARALLERIENGYLDRSSP